MKCNGCKYAEWKLTKNGKLHPSGEGRCNYLKLHPLDFNIPAAFYLEKPRISGGNIERGKEITRGGEDYGKVVVCSFFKSWAT